MESALAVVAGQDLLKLRGNRHGLKARHIGASRVTDRHPDPGKERRGRDSRQLACDFTQIPARPANPQHAEVGANVQPGEALAQNMSTLQVLERTVELAGTSRSLAAGELDRDGTAQPLGPARSVLFPHIFTLRSRSALPTTDTDDRLMASAAIIGLRSRPKAGYRMPAAIGTPSML